MPIGVMRLASLVRLLVVGVLLSIAQGVVANEQVAEVVGVVTAAGSAGVAEDDDEWSLSVSLRPWRVAGGPRNLHALKLRKDGLSETALREQMDELPANAIVRVRVRLRAAAPGSELTQESDGDLLALIGREPDDREMNEWVAERARPVVIKDATFGTLTLDRSVNTYEGERKYRNRRYLLYIDRGSDDDDVKRDRALIESRREVVRRAEAQIPAYLEATADELLDLYNESWRGDSAAIDRKAFMQRLSLDSLSVDEEGGWIVYFDDGGLFGGHAIQVSVEADGEVADVDLAG